LAWLGLAWLSCQSTVWLIVEQVFVAALDVADYELAEGCVQRMTDKFSSNSLRIERLNGMLLESKGLFREALTLYAKILKRDPTEAVCRETSSRHMLE
jgi:ER membrane protein complex subunit 2